jgi:hypothetical protein
MAASALPPSFETLASQAPQDEVDVLRLQASSHAADFVSLHPGYATLLFENESRACTCDAVIASEAKQSSFLS